METNNRDAPSRPSAAGGEAYDPIDAARRYSSVNVDPGGCLWTTANASEAHPGVLAPLAAEYWFVSVYGYAFRVTYHRLGLLGRGDVYRPQPADAVGGAILGRAVCNVDENRRMAHLMPGSSGDDLERAIFGSVRENIDDGPPLPRWRHLLFCWRLLCQMVGYRIRMEAIRNRALSRWREAVREVDSLDLENTVRRLERECNEGQLDVAARGQNLTGVLSPVFLLPLLGLAHRLGSEAEVMQLISGLGGIEETRIMDRLWEVAQGRRTLEGFLGSYGFMGPGTGNLANRNWREDCTSLHPVIAAYADTPPGHRPARRASRKAEEAHRILADLKSRCGWFDRLRLSLAYRWCRRHLPLRETTKTAFFAHAAIGRTYALHAGELLRQAGALEAREDVLYLKRRELLAVATQGEDMRTIVDERKAVHAVYEQLDLPDQFDRNTVQAIFSEFSQRRQTAPKPTAGGRAGPVRSVRGIGVSSGRCEGVARVVLDPDEVDDFRKGQILVCRITDPSWAPLFSIAGALVSDIGGMLSHTSIIAREIGVPAVVSTRDGTRVIRDGQRVAVDGLSGVVELHASNEIPNQ